MSMTSPVPVLQGDEGTELRSEGEELLLRHPHEELRIPLVAIARVRAEGRGIAVELTAPAGAEPTVYRIEDVSRAAASVFADAVNDALPERAAGEEAVDGSTLVTTRSLKSLDVEKDEEEENRASLVYKWVGLVVGVALVAFSVVVGIAAEHVGRAVAVLLLGGLGAGVTFFAILTMSAAWDDWYLPRNGITVEAKLVYLDGTTTYVYTDTRGRTHPIYNSPRGETIRVAYRSKKPSNAVVCDGWGRRLVGDLFIGSFVGAVAGLLDYGMVALALPAFGK